MKRILLHACCAPCSGAIVEALLKEGADFAVFFSNDNIVPEPEYALRLREVLRYAAAMGVEVVEDRYDHDAWRCSVAGLEDEPERGRRCEACFRLRLSETFARAAERGADRFCTTLSISPLKNAPLLNAIGEGLADQAPAGGPRWLPSDFKKRGGYQRSIELSAEYGLYRQNYCGCVFSQRERSARADA